MDTKFCFEWQDLKRSWQEATNKMRIWTVRFTNSEEYLRSIEPKIDAIIIERRQLTEKSMGMEHLIREHKSAIGSRSAYLLNVSRLSEGKLRQKDFDAQLRRVGSHASKVKLKGKPVSLICKAAIEGILRAVDMKRSERNAYFADADRQNAMEIERLLSCIQSNQERMDALEPEFMTIMQETVQRENSKAEADMAEKDRRYKAMLNWGAQDREHLEWILANDLPFSTGAVEIYRKRFPEDNITPLLLQPEVRTSPIHPRRPTRDNGNIIARNLVATKSELRPWEFFLVANEEEAGIPIPSDEMAFIDSLQQLLDGSSIRGINISQVLVKLSMEAKRIDQGCGLNRITGAKFKNWIEGHVGYDYRILMSPDRQTRKIRFFLYAKKDQKFVLVR